MIAALLRDGHTRRDLQRTDVSLHAPEQLSIELSSHLPMLAKRAGTALSDTSLRARDLMKTIDLVPAAALAPTYHRAFSALGHVDAGDVPFLAAALAVDAEAIWSLDLHFDRQHLVKRIERLPS